MEYVLFTIIYLLVFILKGCLYYKVENRKIDMIYVNVLHPKSWTQDWRCSTV